MSKKKILYHSDFSLLKTGFGKVSRLLLSHLYKTGKYDIVHFCCGLTDDNPSFERLPWKNIGAVSKDPAVLEAIAKDPKLAQLASYGSEKIDEVMLQEKPDVYIGVQDIWGVEFAVNKKWFKKSNMAIWTTLDSLPILPMAVKACEKVDNFWCWSDFATKSLHDLGHKHVKTLRGPVDPKNFYRLPDSKRLQLRKKFGLGTADFVVGFVFRNQLRKSVPNLLEGYKKFIDDNPQLENKTRLLLHTNFAEGWGIHKLADELDLPKDRIITTYVCQACGSYGVHNFGGQEKKCPHCGVDKSYNTTGVSSGVTEEQLNEVYNLMDVYCHPFTSGGQEIPIQEAKYTELITLVTDYSCGVDMCVEEASSLALDWSKYREHGTEFIKASTKPESISEQLTNVLKMTPKMRRSAGKQAREWAVENFSVETVGKALEEFIDNCPDVDVEKIYKVKSNQKPMASVDITLPDEEWIISMYKNILDMTVDSSDKGYQYWINEINRGVSRSDVEDFFRATARKEILQKETVEDYLDKDDKGKRLLYVIPESAGDVVMSTSLFKSLKDQYPEYNLYVATKPEYSSLLEGNPYVHKVIPFAHNMEHVIEYEGWGSNRSGGVPSKDGIFEIVILPYINVQRINNYTRNGLDKIPFDLKY